MGLSEMMTALKKRHSDNYHIHIFLSFAALSSACLISTIWIMAQKLALLTRMALASKA
jgi:hypothetical protein